MRAISRVVSRPVPASWRRSGGDPHDGPGRQRVHLAPAPQPRAGRRGRLEGQPGVGRERGGLGAAQQQRLGALVDRHPGQVADPQLAAEVRAALEHRDRSPGAAVAAQHVGRGQAGDPPPTTTTCLPAAPRSGSRGRRGRCPPRRPPWQIVTRSRPSDREPADCRCRPTAMTTRPGTRPSAPASVQPRRPSSSPPCWPPARAAPTGAATAPRPRGTWRPPPGGAGLRRRRERRRARRGVGRVEWLRWLGRVGHRLGRRPAGQQPGGPAGTRHRLPRRRDRRGPRRRHRGRPGRVDGAGRRRGGGRRVVDAGAGPARPRATRTSPLRVPPQDFGGTLDRVGALGRELERTRSARDVTTELADVDSRVRTQERSVARVRTLLAQADTIGEVVQIESRAGPPRGRPGVAAGPAGPAAGRHRPVDDRGRCSSRAARPARRRWRTTTSASWPGCAAAGTRSARSCWWR